ncbi:unnamed protein product [Owenia fusiformis]|uniref:Uncharacterized protein n=1 Tax=Owenia fusiformis TaxID=6347 RepID=A0A8J1U9K7_OWEFU|nr:unnamed protein product [Owenia fusiformis]
MDEDGLVPSGMKFMKTQDGYYMDALDGTTTPGRQCTGKLKVLIMVAALMVLVLMGVSVLIGMAIGGFFKDSTTGQPLADTTAVVSNCTSATEFQNEDNCSGPGDTRSTDGGLDVTTVFKDTLPRTVLLMWIDYNGTADPSKGWQLAPGGSLRLKTNTVHPFVAKIDGTDEWVRIGGQCKYYPQAEHVDIA